jgi:hypothetical protein
VETTLAALQDDSNADLPPLMNPAVLEASDDLTNLSHLNEPAGKAARQARRETASADPRKQCYKQSNCAMRKKRYTHTVV